jgi:hypothetical protein
MKTENNIAPQDKEPALCGQRKCEVCGKPFTHWRKDQIACSFCSKKVAKFRRAIRARNELAARQPQYCEYCGKKLTITRLNGRKKKFCNRRCFDLSRQKGKWVVSHGRSQYERQHDWYLKNRAKAKENNFNYNLFGTSQIPPKLKIASALVKIGKSKNGMFIKHSIINNVLKGETYVVYE